MKLNAGKRILMFFHWLFSLLICAAFALYLLKPDLANGLYDLAISKVGGAQVAIIGIAILAIYTVLAVVQACIIFHRRKRADRGFITVDSSDTGRVRIAVSAIEAMVRQSVNNIDGIADMKIGIENVDDAILINIAASILSGSHVPTITMNMQRAIRQFVEMNCGVAVRSVSISINSVSTSAEGGKRRRGRRGDTQLPASESAKIADSYPAYTPEAPAPAERQEEDYTAEYDEPVRPITLTLEREPAYAADDDTAQADGGAAPADTAETGYDDDAAPEAVDAEALETGIEED